MSAQNDSQANSPNPYEQMVPAYERWALPVSTQIAEALIQRLGDLKGKRLLDVGAGLGSMAVPASQAGAEVVAIDNASAMINRLRERLAPFPHSRADLLNVRELSAQGPEYDVVTSILSAAFMPDADDVFRRMVSITREGGSVCVASWGESYGSPIYRILGGALASLPMAEEAKISPGLSRFLVAAELGQAITAAGCEPVDAWAMEVACELPEPARFQAELEPFLRVIPGYVQLSGSQREELQPLIEQQYQAVPVVDGHHQLRAPANVAIGRVSRGTGVA